MLMAGTPIGDRNCMFEKNILLRLDDAKGDLSIFKLDEELGSEGSPGHRALSSALFTDNNAFLVDSDIGCESTQTPISTPRTMSDAASEWLPHQTCPATSILPCDLDLALHPSDVRRTSIGLPSDAASQWLPHQSCPATSMLPGREVDFVLAPAAFFQTTQGASAVAPIWWSVGAQESLESCFDVEEHPPPCDTPPTPPCDLDFDLIEEALPTRGIPEEAFEPTPRRDLCGHLPGDTDFQSQPQLFLTDFEMKLDFGHHRNDLVREHDSRAFQKNAFSLRDMDSKAAPIRDAHQSMPPVACKSRASANQVALLEMLIEKKPINPTDLLQRLLSDSAAPQGAEENLSSKEDSSAHDACGIGAAAKDQHRQRQALNQMLKANWKILKKTEEDPGEKHYEQQQQSNRYIETQLQGMQNALEEKKRRAPEL